MACSLEGNEARLGYGVSLQEECRLAPYRLFTILKKNKALVVISLVPLNVRCAAPQEINSTALMLCRPETFEINQW